MSSGKPSHSPATTRFAFVAAWRPIAPRSIARASRVPHRQYVFTVPKLIRPFFAYRRSLLGELCRIIARLLVEAYRAAPRLNWAVLGGSLAFVAITLTVGVGGLRFAQELVFAGSLGIILFLLWRLARELEPAAREVLVATALVLFVYRSVPLTGEGSTWWMIDVLKFNEASSRSSRSLATRSRLPACSRAPLHGRALHRHQRGGALDRGRAILSAPIVVCTTACTSGPWRAPAA